MSVLSDRDRELLRENVRLEREIIRPYRTFILAKSAEGVEPEPGSFEEQTFTWEFPAGSRQLRSGRPRAGGEPITRAMYNAARRDRDANRRLVAGHGHDADEVLDLEKQIREEMDKGTPTVSSNPMDPASLAYREIARKMTATLSMRKKDYSSAFPKIVIQND